MIPDRDGAHLDALPERRDHIAGRGSSAAHRQDLASKKSLMGPSWEDCT